MTPMDDPHNVAKPGPTLNGFPIAMSSTDLDGEQIDIPCIYCGSKVDRQPGYIGCSGCEQKRCEAIAVDTATELASLREKIKRLQAVVKAYEEFSSPRRDGFKTEGLSVEDYYVLLCYEMDDAIAMLHDGDLE